MENGIHRLAPLFKIAPPPPANFLQSIQNARYFLIICQACTEASNLHERTPYFSEALRKHE